MNVVREAELVVIRYNRRIVENEMRRALAVRDSHRYYIAYQLWFACVQEESNYVS
jgi:hypothetical protein